MEGELHLKLFLVLLIVVGIVLCLIFVLFTEINFKLLRNYVGQTVDFGSWYLVLTTTVITCLMLLLTC